MWHSYESLLKTFNTRAKGRNYKVMFGTKYWRMTQEESALVISFTKWEYPKLADGRPDYQQRAAEVQVPAFRVTPDNMFELVCDVTPNDNSLKNNVYKMLNRTVNSNSSRYGSHTHKLRFHDSPNGRTVPFAKGFKYDMKLGAVVYHPEDTKRKTNREASKPIVEYVRRVANTVEVMYKIGALAEPKNFAGYYERRKALDNLSAAELDMSEEAITLVAEAAFHDATTRAAKPRANEGRYKRNAKGEWEWVKTDLSEAQRTAIYLDRIKGHVKRQLAHRLKTTKGGYDTVVAL